MQTQIQAQCRQLCRHVLTQTTVTDVDKRIHTDSGMDMVADMDIDTGTHRVTHSMML